MIRGTLISLFEFSQVFLYAAWVVGPALLIFYIITKKDSKNVTLA